AQIVMELADKQYKKGEKYGNTLELTAKSSYQQVLNIFDSWPSYKNNVNDALGSFITQRDKLLKSENQYKPSDPIFIKRMNHLGKPISNSKILTPDKQIKGQALNKSLHIKNITSSINVNRATLLLKKNYPWERVIRWHEDGQNGNSNPVIYALILEA